ncbi:MAG: ABC transporter ATP-binding protein, partial [Deltaproteobacteria bacterium]
KRFVRGQTAVDALAGVEFSVAQGEFVSIMGASGSGKSTLLNILTGLDEPSGGEVWLEGRSLKTMSDDELTDLRRTRIGIVFQFFNLLPSITALENVALPLRASGIRRRHAEEKARSMLETVGLADRAGHLPGELSGGQMQRVAIARALAIEPGLLVADEPTGNLDSTTGAEILDLLARLHREEGATILMVTHSPAAAAYGDRIISMADGRVVDIAVTKRGEARQRKSFARAAGPLAT